MLITCFFSFEEERERNTTPLKDYVTIKANDSTESLVDGTSTE